MLYQKNITEKGSARKEDGKGMNVLLRAEGLTKTYGAGQSAVKALNGVSLEIRRGELLVILGSSGSGKTIEITENDQPVPAERIEW